MKTMTRRWTIFGITTITAFVFAGVVIASQFAAPPDVRHVHVVEVETPRPSGISAGELRCMQRYAWWSDRP